MQKCGEVCINIEFGIWRAHPESKGGTSGLGKRFFFEFSVRYQVKYKSVLIISQPYNVLNKNREIMSSTLQSVLSLMRKLLFYDMVKQDPSFCHNASSNVFNVDDFNCKITPPRSTVSMFDVDNFGSIFNPPRFFNRCFQ